MGSNPDSETDALELRLSRVLAHLVETGDERGVVRLIERWSEQRDLSVEVLLTQARALISLRLMDRAWVRLQEAREKDSADVEAQLLTAEMFVERGWPARARRILERVPVADVDARRLDHLRGLAAQAPLQPPANAQEVERTGNPEAVLGLAERYMAAGSFVRAQSLLERLHREGQGGRRVADLLWAIQGDYSSGKLTLEDLITELSPEIRLSEWEGVELTESLRVREETAHDPEAAARELLASGEGKSESRPAFPDLFRNGEMADDITLHDEDEVTMASSMATQDQMGDLPSDQHTDPGMSVTGDGGDTRIMEVIGQEFQDLEDSRPIHRPVDPMMAAGSELGSTLDLRAYRDSMGMDGLAPDAETFLEEEDQDLIVMTRREGRERPPPVSRRPIVEVVEKGVAGQSRQQAEQVYEPPVIDGEEQEVTEVTEVTGPERGRSRSSQLMVWGVVTGVSMVLIGVLALMGLQKLAGQQVIEDSHTVLASGNFRAIQELEATLDGEVKVEREPFDVRMVELALVRVILWSDYTGDVDRLNAVQEALTWIDANGGPRNEAMLVRGFLSLARGDLASAQEYAAKVKSDEPVGRILVARVALARAERPALESAWTALGGRSGADGPLVQALSVEAIASATEQNEIAETIRQSLVEQYSDNALLQLARFEERWDASLDDEAMLVEIGSARDLLSGAISPRQSGRFHALRARHASGVGKAALARNAWRRALIEDPTHPMYLYMASVDAVRENRLIAAEDDLRRCLESRPWEPSCRRGTVQVLIGLDRIQTARDRVDSWKGPGVDVSELEAWIMLADGHPQDALDALGARGRQGGVAAFVESMARAELGAPGASEALVGVVQAMSESSDVLDRILAGRAEAARMPLVPRDASAAVEARAVTLAPSDPGVHVLIGRHYEAAGRRTDAGDAFDLAARIGVESGRAHHARGLFYFEPRGDMTQARSAWRRYLALQPDGARAERVRERLSL